MKRPTSDHEVEVEKEVGEDLIVEALCEDGDHEVVAQEDRGVLTVEDHVAVKEEGVLGVVAEIEGDVLEVEVEIAEIVVEAQEEVEAHGDEAEVHAEEGVGVQGVDTVEVLEGTVEVQYEENRE